MFPSDHNFNHVLKLIENDPLHTCDRRRVDVGSVFHHLSSCLVVFNQFRDLWDSQQKSEQCIADRFPGGPVLRGLIFWEEKKQLELNRNGSNIVNWF